MTDDEMHDRADKLRADLLTIPGVNTYCVNQKDPTRGYDRKWTLRVVWNTTPSADMADPLRVSEYVGNDSPAGYLDVYQRAHSEATRRGLFAAVPVGERGTA